MDKFDDAIAAIDRALAALAAARQRHQPKTVMAEVNGIMRPVEVGEPDDTE